MSQPVEGTDAYGEDAGDDDAEDGVLQDDAFDRHYQNDHSWEQLEEDEFGRLVPLNQANEQRAKRQKLLNASQTARIRKGLIRYVQLVIDLSQAASVQDMRPSRLAVMINVCKLFIREFFDQNPLSQLGIIVMRNGLAERVTELSGTPEAQVAKLASSLEAGGAASLQNALDLGLSLLQSLPPYGHREILILFACLNTCDPGNILDSVTACKENRIRVSIVGVASEVYICKKITELTGGTYGVALNEQHLEELMLKHAPPPPLALGHTTAELVRMGFPQRSAADASASVFVGPDCALRGGGYTCPKCSARVIELPCDCHVCGLTLISSPHLARSYHHLFPIRPFVEVVNENGASRLAVSKAGVHKQCFGCLKDLQLDEATGAVIVQCPTCKEYYCFDCDTYIHESLHNCPGCESKPLTAEQ